MWGSFIGLLLGREVTCHFYWTWRSHSLRWTTEYYEHWPTYKQKKGKCTFSSIRSSVKHQNKGDIQSDQMCPLFGGILWQTHDGMEWGHREHAQFPESQFGWSGNGRQECLGVGELWALQGGQVASQSTAERERIEYRRRLRISALFAFKLRHCDCAKLMNADTVFG